LKSLNCKSKFKNPHQQNQYILTEAQSDSIKSKSAIISKPASPIKSTTMASTQFPQIGKPAPDFTGLSVVDGQFKTIKLADYKGSYVILFFYPLDFTFVCPTEIVAFSEAAEQFKNVGAQLIACSTDSHFSHLAWVNIARNKGGLGEMKIPLLADKTGKISRDYGVYIEEQGIALRGLFVIDPKGILRQITINDLPIGRSVEESLRLVQAIKFFDENGEVCPANWKPGKKTIKPTVEKSKEYFENVQE